SLDENGVLVGNNTAVFENLTLYAKWQAVDVEPTYVITWKNHDGTILLTQNLEEGVLPAYTGTTPKKAETETHTYVFAGWTPTIALVTKDQIYTATFTEEAKSTSDYKQDLNTIFEFNISALLPEMVVNDYQIFDDSDDEMIAVYLYVFNWDLEDALAYMDLLDLELTYDSIEDAWVLGDYFLYVFDDDIEFGELFYGIGIYGYLEDGTDPGDPVEGTPFDKNELNALFGFDIYELMPDFASNSSLISDYSDETVIDVY